MSSDRRCWISSGDVPHGARPYCEGLPKQVWKLTDDFAGDTYRLAYTTAFPGLVYVLDVFKKKSKKGKKTPKVDKDRALRRYQDAEKHYNENYRDK